MRESAEGFRLSLSLFVLLFFVPRSLALAHKTLDRRKKNLNFVGVEIRT